MLHTVVEASRLRGLSSILAPRFITEHDSFFLSPAVFPPRARTYSTSAMFAPMAPLPTGAINALACT